MAATSNYSPQNPFLVGLDNARDGRARLLPLAFAAIWACTALPVEVSSPWIFGEIRRVGIVDLVVNVFLYVPLGMALRRGSALRAAGVTAALSVGVEAMQLFYPDRFAAVSDVVANVFGAMCGWCLSNRIGARSLWGFDPLRITTRIAVFCVILYAAALTTILSLPGRPSDFSNWDAGCRLVVGDELTRNRPWRGDIDAVAIFDECFSRAEIERLSRKHPGSILDSTRSGLRPLFTARPVAPLDSIRGTPLLGGQDNKRFFDAFVTRGQLTLLVWFRTRSENQKGPARIVSFSKTPWSQNFSLGQEGRSVVFRLRTPTTIAGGFFPQIKTRGLLEKGAPIFVAATYDGRNSRVFVDGRPEGRINLRARGRSPAFFADNGLPAMAMFLGALMAVAWVAAAGRARMSVRLWGTIGGLFGGGVFVLSGGASALPEFAPWVPVVGGLGGLAVGCAVAAGEATAGEPLTSAPRVNYLSRVPRKSTDG